MAFQKFPSFRFVVLIGSGQPRTEDLKNLLKDPLSCPSIHFIGQISIFFFFSGVTLQNCFYLSSYV